MWSSALSPDKFQIKKIKSLTFHMTFVFLIDHSSNLTEVWSLRIWSKDYPWSIEAFEESCVISSPGDAALNSNVISAQEV